MVLLRNEGNVLPLDPSKSTAVIGPLAKNKHDMLGPWWGRGDDDDVVTVFDGIDEQNTAPTTLRRGLQALEHRGAAHGSRGLRSGGRLHRGRRGGARRPTRS